MKRLLFNQCVVERRYVRACAAACVWMSLVSCGGSGVVGSGGTGQAASVTVGTVNGFGSVIVDGVAYDVTQAVVVDEVAPGQDAVADVKLGDRVAVQVVGTAVASQVRVLPALDGPVSAVATAASFTVLGQTVSVNATGVGGPVTQFGGGYVQPGDVAVGDQVEVHAVVVEQGGATALQATRVDKLAAAPAYLRVSGLISQLSSTAPASLSVGALRVLLGGASVVPAGATLAVGQAVSVLALPGTLAIGSNGPRLTAAQLSVDTPSGTGHVFRASGSIAQLDTVAQTFLLGAQAVHYAAAALLPAGVTLANGQYVDIGATVAADGSLTATTVSVDDEQTDSSAELNGDISGLATGSALFTVRGVTVDASQAALTGCPASGLTNGLFVQVQGTLISSGVVARTVRCQAEPSGATVTRQGQAGSVDTGSSRFTLALSGATSLTVRWSSTTFFGGVTPATLSGRTVEVEGTLAGSVLTASKIALDN